MATRKGRPKHLRPHDVKLILPKDIDKYMAKRLYWALLELEKKMSRDITKVSMKEYDFLLKQYAEMVKTLNKKGIKYKYNEKTKQGMVVEATKEGSANADAEAEASGDGFAGMGAGIQADNPIT